MRLFLHIATFLSLGLFFACGSNTFESQETYDPAEDAAIELENENPGRAIEILEAALEDDPTNATYISLLSLAYAQRAGVEPLTFASNFAEQSDSVGESEDANQFTVMFAIMPEASASNISDINTAISLLASLSAEERKPGDDFKLAMFNTAAVVLVTKQFDNDLDGDLTPEEVANLSDAAATALLTQIANAEALLAGEEGSSNEAAAGAFTTFRTSLDAQEGASDEEKLKNFLASGQETE